MSINPGGRPAGGEKLFGSVPPIVLWMCGAIGACFIVFTTLPRNLKAETIARFAVWPKRWTESGEMALERHGAATGPLADAAPLVTHVLLHANFMHVAFNLLWLLVFGVVVARRVGADDPGERVQGALRLVLLFVAAGAAGGLAHLALNWGDSAPMVGASGAIAGLMGATSRCIGRAPWAPLAELNDRRVVGFAVAWILVNAAFAFSASFAAGLSGGEVSWEAHLGGYAAGVLAFPLFDRPRRRPFA